MGADIRGFGGCAFVAGICEEPGADDCDAGSEPIVFGVGGCGTL